MTIEIMDMTAPAAVLTGLYATIVLLLLSLQLKSRWRWPIKALAIGLALPAMLGTFLAVQAQLGWPSRHSLPEQFQLHAALIDEPSSSAAEGGAIYLWLTPWNDAFFQDGRPGADDDAGLDSAVPSDRRPRAFDLPYSRDLHQQVEDMQERLARGDMVIGRHQPRSSWERRFGQQLGTVDLEAPPPPPLPAKEG
jgi:hypothetical protein